MQSLQVGLEDCTQVPRLAHQAPYLPNHFPWYNLWNGGGVGVVTPWAWCLEVPYMPRQLFQGTKKHTSPFVCMLIAV